MKRTRMTKNPCMDVLAKNFIHNLSSFNHMSFFDDKTGVVGSNFKGIGVFSVGRTRKLRRIWMRAILVCIKPKRNPIQFLNVLGIKLEAMVGLISLPRTISKG